MNISTVDLDKTANTNYLCAEQRAKYLAFSNVSKVLELCVGPSLKVLETAYKAYKIDVWGNDIDARWFKYYPQGNWIQGDALSVSYSNYDTIVFAPPLSKGCTGTREDSLSPLSVYPGYLEFLKRFSKEPKFKRGVLVLPGRSLSTKQDRKETHRIINACAEVGIVQCHALAIKGVNKYIDLEVVRI